MSVFFFLFVEDGVCFIETKQTYPLLDFPNLSFTLPPFVPGLRGSLQRMQLEYVDVVFANRPDSNTPMEGK